MVRFSVYVVWPSVLSLNYFKVLKYTKQKQWKTSLYKKNLFILFIILFIYLFYYFHSFVPKDLSKNFTIFKKCKNKFDCVIYKMFF